MALATHMASKMLEKSRTRRPMGAWRRFATGALLGFAMLGGAALAVPIPFDGRDVELTAREQPVALFLQDFFGRLALPVSVSPSVKGAISGSFRGPADQVFDKIVRAIGLVPYFDGSVVYVYTTDEMVTRVFQVPHGGAVAVMTQARQDRLIDERNTLRVSRNGCLIASGTKRFVEMVNPMGGPLGPGCAALGAVR